MHQFSLLPSGYFLCSYFPGHRTYCATYPIPLVLNYGHIDFLNKFPCNFGLRFFFKYWALIKSLLFHYYFDTLEKRCKLVSICPSLKFTLYKQFMFLQSIYQEMNLGIILTKETHWFLFHHFSYSCAFSVPGSNLIICTIFSFYVSWISSRLYSHSVLPCFHVLDSVGECDCSFVEYPSWVFSMVTFGSCIIAKDAEGHFPSLFTLSLVPTLSVASGSSFPKKAEQCPGQPEGPGMTLITVWRLESTRWMGRCSDGFTREDNRPLFLLDSRGLLTVFRWPSRPRSFLLWPCDAQLNVQAPGKAHPGASLLSSGQTRGIQQRPQLWLLPLPQFL